MNIDTQELKEELRTELRAVREELARRELSHHGGLTPNRLVTPPRNHSEIRLQEFSADQLLEHEDRLERDLDDLDVTNAEQLYRPTESE